MIGTEHEFSLNSRGFLLVPDSDRILEEAGGSPALEVPFGPVRLSKELQKTVIEFSPEHPARDVPELESSLLNGLARFWSTFGTRYTLLGLGMHPLARPADIPVWDHEEAEYYAEYDRLFDLCQHGWRNVQAFQVNLSYDGEADLVRTYNLLRPLLPYLVALTAASPFVEGEETGYADNRLRYYMTNQSRIPSICGELIPERIGSLAGYNTMMEEIYRDLRHEGGDLLCSEWVNSRGVIIRFSRPCLEVRALDEQDCLRSGMGICAFLTALLRAGPGLGLEEDQDDLIDMTATAIREGVAPFRDDLIHLYKRALALATPAERIYLPVIRRKVMEGSPSEVMMKLFRGGTSVTGILSLAAYSLFTNVPLSAR